MNAVAPALKAWRVLVVDDDEMLNYLFCCFLESKGVETVSAGSVAATKKILQTDENLDLILLDYQLGDGVGMDVLDPSATATYLKQLPVIMISANEESEFLERCFAAGVNDYIIKPVNLSLLALKVNAIIKSVAMQELIRSQNKKLEIFKQDAEREEQVAKFTYEYLLRQNSTEYPGVDRWLKSFAAFSGDMMLIRKSLTGSLYFILADATGHGLSAAITIMPVVAIFNAMVARGFHIQQMVAEINRKLVSDTPSDRFVAAIMVEINPYRRELSVWNGGMPTAYWVNDGHILHEFHSVHMALGIMDDAIFDAGVVTIDLPESGYLFTYSDGLTEAENKLGQQFSAVRVKNIIAAKPDHLLRSIATDLYNFTGSDDYADDVSACRIEPSIVFAEINSDQPIALDNNDARVNCFLWQVNLSGQLLLNCEIPLLCNQFLQHMNIDQQLCQKIFAVIAEMVSNAVDHGVLNLDSNIKQHPDGFMKYFREREMRAKKLTDSDYVRISMQWVPNDGDGYLVVEVEDSGRGYTPTVNADSGAPKYSGRGNHLIQHLTESVEIFSPGNKIRATIK